MKIVNLTGREYYALPSSRFHIFVEPLHRGGLTPMGIWISKAGPKVEGIVVEFPTDTSYVDAYAPDLCYGDHVIFPRWCTELLDRDCGWEDVEVAPTNALTHVTTEGQVSADTIFVEREIHVVDIREVEAIVA